MTRLSIALLGGFRVAAAGRVVTQLESDKGRALLAYLAVNWERSYKRTTLAALFWPDSSAKDGRNNLRQTLFKIRRALGENGERSYFLANRVAIRFNRQSDDWLDIEAIPQADAAEMLQIYTGPFLDQVYLDDCQEFEEWTLVQREWIHQQAMNRFYQLAEEALDADDYETARQLAVRQIRLDRWREAARRQLMRVLTAQNKFSAALAQYETCRVVLADELGVAPARETTELYHIIQTKMQLPAASDSAAVPRHNLPTTITPFIGRVEETRDVYGRLTDPACRLLTLIGPGGIGKTRLALHVAAGMSEIFTDGIFFAPLVGIMPDAHPQEQIIHAIAESVGLIFSGSTPPRRQLAGYLRARKILLVVDNFEHMLAGAEVLDHLLQNVPLALNDEVPLKILVTSRQQLALTGEWLMPVYGLAYPAVDDDDIDSFDAMKLFWQRARMVNPDFIFSVMAKPFAAQICRMAGGHPLAIMLAASWTRTLPCSEVAAEMKRDLGILQASGRSLTARHKDLRVVLRQSWQKLSVAAQTALLRLALFPGGFTRKAGTAVAQATPLILQELTDYAFLSRDNGEPVRYHIHELLRQFALELLVEEGEAEAAKETMMRYYGRFLSEMMPKLRDERHRTAIRAMHTELDNIRICWHWACTMENVDFLHAGLESITLYYELHDLFQEGEDLLADAEVLLADDGRFQARRGMFLYHLDQFERSGKLLKSALAQAEAAGNEMEIGFCTGHLWNLFYMHGQQDDIFRYAQRTLDIARNTGDIILLAIGTAGMVGYYTRDGDMEAAEKYGRESAAAYKRLGNPLSEIMAAHNLAYVILVQGKNQEAEQLLRDCLALSIRHQAAFMEMGILVNLSWAVSNQGRHEDALEMLERVLAFARSTGNRYRECEALSNMGEVYTELGMYDLAYAVLYEALPIHREVDNFWGAAYTQLIICDMFLAQDKLEEAEAALEIGLKLAEESGGHLVTSALALLADLRVKQGDEETAVALAQQVLDSAEAMSEAKEKAQAVLAACF